VEVVKIYSFSGNTSPTANTDLSGFLDVTNRYQTDSGQKITHYDHAAIKLKPGYSSPTGNLIVCCRAFKTTNDVGYFSVDSYPSINAIVTEEGNDLGTGYSLIPVFAGVRLSDVIDFRPVRPNASNAENFSFNTSRIPVPVTDFRSDYSHYLPRRDLVSLNLNRDIELIQGKSQINPIFPIGPNRNLTLQKISLNPYTVSKRDIAIENLDHRRYTMKDIASIDRRLKNVEYSVSLSDLEKRAEDILIQDVDGLDRTKYGILAESFNSHLLGDTSSPDYACAVDTIGKYSGTDGMLMPKLASNYFELEANTRTAQGVSLHDDKVMLGYSTQAAISQTVATKTTPITEYLFADFRGDIITIPEADIWKDTTLLPDVVISLPVIETQPVTPKVIVRYLDPKPGSSTLTLPDPNKQINTNTTINSIAPTALPLLIPEYYLIVSNRAIDEGNTVTFTLETRNVQPGSVVRYIITGVSSADLNGASLTGAFVVSDTTPPRVTFTTTNDFVAEGDETLIFTLYDIFRDASGVGLPSAIASVIIRDVSPPAPIYSVFSSKSTVDEGESFQISLVTTNVPAGTL
jgi:hypothetical protein